MAEKESQLNGSYPGPSIPPPNQEDKHKSRGRFCCLFGWLWKTIVALILIIVLAIFICWLILQPRMFKVHITDAKLTQFNFTNNNNNLQYKLDLNITLRNPNKKMAIYFDKIEANAFYEGQRFDTENLTKWGFKVERKSTHFLNATFAGQQWMELGANELDFNEEKSVGVYSIYLKCYLRIRFRIGDFIGGHHKPKVRCGLKVPLISNGNLSTARFEITRCDVQLF
ncbi:NDR1/HIN1-like protein 10 [Quercus lobata]|uniref:NDR1/HIN1-like protein 10 n=1 Tax=Quercus lobata TaxID=97700 RepID=UPI001244302A|nr:NDR1/HIN1-like protein 10 [Quercus lobata]